MQCNYYKVEPPLPFVHGKPAFFGSSIEQTHLVQSLEALLGSKAVSGEGPWEDLHNADSLDVIQSASKSEHFTMLTPKLLKVIRLFSLLLVCYSSLYSVALPSFIWLGHWRNLPSL